MIIGYLEIDKKGTLIEEANRFLEERARKRNYESYAALRDAHAKRRGHKNWEEYREYLFRKKEAKEYLEKNKPKKRRRRRTRVRPSLSPRQFRINREVENLFTKDRMTESELVSALCLAGGSTF